MERYLVDTSVLIDLSRGIAGIRERLVALSASGAELGICAVNVAEFTSGIPGTQLWRWDRLLQEFNYWDISFEAAMRAGTFRHTLRRQGITLQVPDALIAAVAATVDATILSDNVRHFRLISDVRVRSPRS
jgi:tRNA(fMet)-specific endonuclease VapC